MNNYHFLFIALFQGLCAFSQAQSKISLNPLNLTTLFHPKFLVQGFFILLTLELIGGQECISISSSNDKTLSLQFSREYYNSIKYCSKCCSVSGRYVIKRFFSIFFWLCFTLGNAHITEIRTRSTLPWEFLISVMPGSWGVTLRVQFSCQINFPVEV